MDDIIVVIITLIIMVAGAIGQAKKKKGHVVTENTPHQGLDPSIWDFLDEKNYSQLQPEAVNTVVPSKSTKKETYDQPLEMVTGSLENISERVYKKEKPLEDAGDSLENQSTGRLKPEFSPKSKEILVEGLKNNLPEGFSLKKAVIFSEIIQRKYS